MKLKVIITKSINGRFNVMLEGHCSNPTFREYINHLPLRYYEDALMVARGVFFAIRAIKQRGDTNKIVRGISLCVTKSAESDMRSYHDETAQDELEVVCDGKTKL